MCERAHVYRTERGTLAVFRAWKGDICPHFASQLEKNCFPVGQQNFPSWLIFGCLQGLKRSARSAFRRCDLGCKPRILSTNR